MSLFNDPDNVSPDMSCPICKVCLWLHEGIYLESSGTIHIEEGTCKNTGIIVDNTPKNASSVYLLKEW